MSTTGLPDSSVSGDDASDTDKGEDTPEVPEVDDGDVDESTVTPHYDIEDIQALLPPCELKGIGIEQPSSGWAGWCGYLTSLRLCCKADGALLFVDDEWGYIVFPNGVVYSALVRHTINYMEVVRKTGALNTLRAIKTMRMRIASVLGKPT